MKNNIYILFVLLIIQSCNSPQETVEIEDSRIIVYSQDSIITQHLQYIDSIVNIYDDVYALPYDTLYLSMKKMKSRKVANGTATTLAHSEAGGSIAFNSNEVFPAGKDLRNIIVHELFHTLSPLQEDTTIFERHYMLPNISQRIVVYGYCDFALLGNIDDKGLGILTSMIDEGAAEYCAFSLVSGYSISDPSYFNAGMTFKLLSNHGLIDPVSLSIYKKSADLKGLLSHVLGREATRKDIIDIGLLFMKIKIEEENANSVFEKILKLR